MQIVTGRRGEPHVTSRQMQAVYRSFLGDFALLDVGAHLAATATSNDNVRISDGVVAVQGIYAVIAYNEYDDNYIEPVSVGMKRIDTLILHYTKSNDIEDMQIEVVEGEEAVDNPVAPTIAEGGDAWEGTADIKVPIYDVLVTSFGLTVTPYSRMNTLIPTLDSIAERIPESIVTGVKGDSEVLYRNGNVNITKANVGLGDVDNTSDLSKPISNATQTALNLKADLVYVDAKIAAAYHAGGSKTVAELTSALLIADNMGKVYNMSDSGTTTSDFVEGAGEPINKGDNVGICNVGTEENPVYKFDLLSGFVDLSAYVTTSALNTRLAEKVDKVPGKGLSTNDYTNEEKQKNADNASAIEDIQEDISQSLTATGNPLTIESSESNLVECIVTISSSTNTVTITVKDKSTNPTVTNTYTIDLGRTVSSGTLDVVKGTLTTGGTTYNLPPTQIKLLKGNNVISSNVSSLSIKYYPDNVLGQLKGDIESEYDERIVNLEEKVDARTAKVYSFHINDAESNPSDKVTYLDDAVGMTPAYMNYSTGKFNYGSWGNVWFVKECKPCILGQDGKVQKYLNPNDYTKDIDGNTVTIDSTLTGANVMIEFPKIWYKVTPDSNDAYSGTVSISPVKIDEGYKDYAYIDYQGHHKEHFYMPAYNGSNVNNVMRSISGQAVSKTLNVQTEVNYCKANGDGWYTEDAGEIMLINFLLILMGKSTDTQTVFGQGLHTGGTEAINNGFTTGIHYNKGMFYGTNSGTIASNNYSNAVKVFGIENYWGFQWRRYAGDILVNGIRKIKLCYGNEDGSSTFDYNLTGNDYVNVGATPSSTSGGYISEMKFTNTGMYSKVSSGSSSTYYCDGQYFNNSGTSYALRGGDSGFGTFCGAFFVDLDRTASDAWWSFGAAPSYK